MWCECLNYWCRGKTGGVRIVSSSGDLSVEKSSCELVSIKTVVAYAMLDAIISCNIPLTSASELLCIRQASSNNRCMRSTTSRLYKICRNTTRLREDQLIGLMACGLRDVITWVAGDNFRQLLEIWLDLSERVFHVIFVLFFNK